MIATQFCGLELQNPLVLSSGILASNRDSLHNVIHKGAGAVAIKSISKEPRKGHENPTVISYDAGLMNAIGYANPGLEEAKKQFATVGTYSIPVFASIIGTEAEDFAYMAEHFLHDGFSAVELPLSCPHTPGFGVLAGQNTPEACLKITKAVKERTHLPIIVKLFPGGDICEIAQAAEEAGAAAINMGNTHGPGMLINIETASPILDFKVGGVSGPAVKPFILRAIYDIYKAIHIPIIGTGGVMNWRDAIEMLMAGAQLVGIGSAIYYKGLDVFADISIGMQTFMQEQGYTSISDMLGKAHEH